LLRYQLLTPLRTTKRLQPKPTKAVLDEEFSSFRGDYRERVA
jgi:hypothetical protein